MSQACLNCLTSFMVVLLTLIDKKRGLHSMVCKKKSVISLQKFLFVSSMFILAIFFIEKPALPLFQHS